MSDHEKTLEVVRRIIDSNPVMATALLKSILNTDSEQLDALQLLGICYLQSDQLENAKDIFEKLKILDPSAANHANLASCHSKAKRHDLAIAELQQAVEINPSEPLLWSNLAIQHHFVSDYEKAFKAIHKAMDLKPNDPVVLNNYGNLYSESRQFESAVACYETAIDLDPEYANAHVNLSLAYHFMGDWKKGFKEYEWRFWHYPDMQYYLKAYDRNRLWDGKTSLKDMRLLIHGEQGLGDILMFCRFAEHFKSLGAHVTFNVPTSLKELMQSVKGIDRVVDCDIYNSVAKLPDYDYQISSMSAPYLLGLTEISGKPYIQPHVVEKSSRLRVGIVWSGNQDQPDDHERSIPFQIFKELMIPDVDFFSLQMGTNRSHGTGLKDLMVGVSNFNDTRRVLADVDLVIGCQTSVMHLAGAIGKPTWTLLAYDPDWRWGAEGDTTMWYDSMRLFRQTKKGDWAEVIQRVREELKKQKPD